MESDVQGPEGRTLQPPRLPGLQRPRSGPLRWHLLGCACTRKPVEEALARKSQQGWERVDGAYPWAENQAHQAAGQVSRSPPGACFKGNDAAAQNAKISAGESTGTEISLFLLFLREQSNRLHEPLPLGVGTGTVPQWSQPRPQLPPPPPPPPPLPLPLPQPPLQVHLPLPRSPRLVGWRKSTLSRALLARGRMARY